LQDYEALAREFAGEELRLAGLKERLARNRTTYPLFDTERAARHIEAAYVTMWQRYQGGEAPAGCGESKPIRIA
jgi:predicted O-linked N-acetylglucosamine transferase (SPINDLY family)